MLLDPETKLPALPSLTNFHLSPIRWKRVKTQFQRKGPEHIGLGRMGTATFDFVGNFDRDFDTFVQYGNKYQLEGRNPDLDEKKIDFIHQLMP